MVFMALSLKKLPIYLKFAFFDWPKYCIFWLLTLFNSWLFLFRNNAKWRAIKICVLNNFCIAVEQLQCFRKRIAVRLKGDVRGYHLYQNCPWANKLKKMTKADRRLFVGSRTFSVTSFSYMVFKPRNKRENAHRN